MKMRTIRLARAVGLGMLVWPFLAKGGVAEKAVPQRAEFVRCPPSLILGKANKKEYDANGVRCVVGDGVCPEAF
jgi:hypothetical protein